MLLPTIYGKKNCDGGRDHRTNLISIQTSLVCLFLKEDRDMDVAVKTPPYNSWEGPAERDVCLKAGCLMREQTSKTW